MKSRIINILMAVALLLSSCMEYDMALPRTLAEFTDFQVENADKVTIDRDTRTVTIELNETADLSGVNVTSIALNENSKFATGSFPEVLDLTEPYKVTLRMYYDFDWTIVASQKVSRYVKCLNQVGDASFDVERKEAFVYVSKSQRLKNLVVNDLKFELEGSKIVSTTGLVDGQQQTQTCSFPMTLDCTVKRTFLVESRGERVEWSLTAIPKDVPAQITSIAAWCWSADLMAEFDGTSTPPSVMYKAAADSDWIEVVSDKVTVDGINVKARIEGLEQGTSYEAKLVFNGKELPVKVFKTDEPQQIPNMNFDAWWQDGKVWYPYAQDAAPADKAWDSANKGAAQYIGSSTLPEYEDLPEAGKREGAAAVKMVSKWAMVKFAAGNLYTGKFNHLVGIEGANLDWGVPFTAKPKALKGWYKYEPQLITRQNNTQIAGKEMDKCQLQVLLIQTDSPYIVQPMNGLNGPTYKGVALDLATEPTVIARFIHNMDGTGGEWKQFELPLEYRDYRQPTYVIVTAASSYLGDFFTGGEGSTMLIDEFEFVYE